MFPTRRLQTFWNKIVFRAGSDVALSKPRFVAEVTKAYLSDKEGLKKEITAAYRSFFPLLDRNLNCKIDAHEFLLIMQTFAYNNKAAISEYVESFNAPDGIPITNMIEAWTKFHTDPSLNDAEWKGYQKTFVRPSMTSSVICV